MTDRMKGIVTRTAMLAALLCQDSIQTRGHVMGLSRTDAMATRRLDDTHPASTRLLESCYPDVSKLKIESVTGENIAVFELQVLSDGINVALNKTASQSSALGTCSDLVRRDVPRRNQRMKGSRVE